MSEDMSPESKYLGTHGIYLIQSSTEASVDVRKYNLKFVDVYAYIWRACLEMRIDYRAQKFVSLR